jgi:MurNAc alpha-1-phosphate uridylyltransferase
LPHLGSEPFFVVNSDSIWIDEGKPALERLRARWDGGRMDCLLLLCHPERTIGYDGRGDFLMDAEGRLTGRPARNETGLAYIGAYLVHPRLFAHVRLSKFSMNLLWDRAIAERRLYGIEHQGKWLHVGTPDAIPLAERALLE